MVCAVSPSASHTKVARCLSKIRPLPKLAEVKTRERNPPFATEVPYRNTLPRNTLPKHASKRVIWIREPHSLAVAPPSFWRLRTGLRLGQVREPASVRPRPLDKEPKIGRLRLFVQREFRVDFALLGPRALDLIGGRDTALLPSLAMGLGPVVAFLRCRDMALLPRLTVGLGSVAAFPR